MVLFEEAVVAEPVVKLPKYDNKKGNRKRVENMEGVEEKKEEMLIALLGPRAECGSWLGRTGKERVFGTTNMWYVARDCPDRPVLVELFIGTDARGQSPGGKRGYLQWPSVSGYELGYGGQGGDSGVQFVFR